jgi:DNA polymerase III delta subunit
MNAKTQAKNRKPQVFLFCGDDDYTTAQTVKRWEEAFVKKHSAHSVVKIACAENGDWAKDLAGALESPGLFGSARLVMVKDIFEQKAEDTEWLLSELERLDAWTFLLFYEARPVKKTLKFYKKLLVLQTAGKAQIFEHTLPVGFKLNQFLIKYAASRGYKLGQNAAEKLAVALGRDLVEKKFQRSSAAAGIYDLWQATAEVDKLGAYAAGREITVADVALLVSEKVSDNIFLLTNALGAKQSRLARKYLDQLFLNGHFGDPKARALPIVGALAAQFRSLLLLHSAQKAAGVEGNLVEILGWSPYRVNANLRVLKNFTEPQLKEMLAKLLEIDRQLKSTPLPPKFLLGQLLRLVE